MYKNMKATAVDTASDIFGGAKDIASQIGKGWDNTKEQVELPEWMQKVLRLQEDIGTGKGGPDPGEEPPKHSRSGKVVTGAAAAGAWTQIVDDERDGEDIANDDQMMVLTKKMIEIRNILSNVGQSSALTLPSIVVIGSQSSGKSSVLEAIVGHEFLPKGSNMVTRRPIELTLVNTPDSKSEYGEFPDLGLKTSDFSSVQRTLTDLNLAVPDSECVSDDPIRLSIYSPSVPDLSLIDLPGYIQVVGQNQPLELKSKIAELCDKYIQAPNVILAISAADVDLANSTALRASRRVDPRGERTIGVVTKMDLVDPIRGAAILSDKQYPLRLGYVGVVSRAPGVKTLFNKGFGSNLTTTIAKNESAFFSSHPLEFGPDNGLSLGTLTLRKKLMHVLEQTMSASLQSTHDAIKQELEEATYEFKVQYNDRPLSAESYLAESLDAFKHSFKQFTEEFGRPQMKEILKKELDQRVLDLLALRYWNKPITDLSQPPPEVDTLADLPKADPNNPYWHRQLDASTASLTKLGVGRLATSAVAATIQEHIEQLIAQSTFANHPFAREAITNAASSILNERFYSTSDQVENCIKPYKFEIDVEDREWTTGREHVGGVLKGELDACQNALTNLEKAVGGRRKMKEVMGFVDKCRKGDIIVEGDGRIGAGGFSAALLEKGKSTGHLPGVTPFPAERCKLTHHTQAARQSSCATAQTSSTCVCWRSSRGSARTTRTSTTVRRCSWTRRRPSWRRRRCCSSTWSCCPSSTTTSRASSTRAWAATSRTTRSSASPRRTPRSSATSRSSAARSCWSSSSTRWRASGSSRALAAAAAGPRTGRRGRRRAGGGGCSDLIERVTR
jgi:replication fork clamp-binding protein CrfC